MATTPTGPLVCVQALSPNATITRYTMGDPRTGPWLTGAQATAVLLAGGADRRDAEDAVLAAWFDAVQIPAGSDTTDRLHTELTTAA